LRQVTKRSWCDSDQQWWHIFRPTESENPFKSLSPVKVIRNGAKWFHAPMVMVTFKMKYKKITEAPVYHDESNEPTLAPHVSQQL
jgi:hypothetical protein